MATYPLPVGTTTATAVSLYAGEVDFSAANATMTNGAQTVDGAGLTIQNADDAALTEFATVSGVGMRVASSSATSSNVGFTMTQAQIEAVCGTTFDPSLDMLRVEWLVGEDVPGFNASTIFGPRVTLTGGSTALTLDGWYRGGANTIHFATSGGPGPDSEGTLTSSGPANGTAIDFLVGGGLMKVAERAGLTDYSASAYKWQAGVDVRPTDAEAAITHADSPFASDAALSLMCLFNLTSGADTATAKKMRLTIIKEA